MKSNDFWLGSFDGDGKRKPSSSSRYSKPPCYLSHPPLLIPHDGKLLKVYGGNGKATPPPDTAVFISLLEHTLYTKSALALNPWNDSFHGTYPIRNMSVPDDAEDFKRFIKFLADCLYNEAAVYIGCHGGHGRTGLVLAALYYEITKDKKAIKIVRETYCQKAVETSAQANWLKSVYGMNSYARSTRK